MSLSSIMAGADGLEIEVHPSPCDALSDADQQLNAEEFIDLMKAVKKTVEFRRSL